MFPVHQFDLHPHQRNEMQPAPSHYPSFEAIPHQMRGDPDRLYYQSWPCSNYGYVYPAQSSHGCCEHNHFPGYYGLRSPYAQPPPPYYHGNYPLPPGVHPISYVPPPYHTMELPHYEYDKDTGGYYHCCGCPNNLRNRKGGTNVKLEETGPRLESKKDESLVPFNSRNYPDQFVWYSPSNIKNTLGKRTDDAQYEKPEDASNSAKTHCPHPIFWFPSNEIVNKQNNKSNEAVHGKQEDDSSSVNTNFPYPILWFPSTYISNKGNNLPNERQDEKHEGSSNGSKTHEIRQQPLQQGDDRPDEKESKDHKEEYPQRTPTYFNIYPEMVLAAEGNDNSEMNDEIIGHKGPKGMVKTNILKTIPVKQAEPIEREKSEKIDIQKTIPVEQAEPNKGEKNEEQPKSSAMPSNCIRAGKSFGDGCNRKSSSPTNSSKLPPVCLRVDPLPRKKYGDGGSRSPSPPGQKGNSKEMYGENVDPSSLLDAKAISGLPSRDAKTVREKDKEQGKSKTKTIQVCEGTASQPGNGNLPNSSSKVALTSQTNHEPRDAVDSLDVKCKSVTGTNSEGAEEDKSLHFNCQTDENEGKSKAEELTNITKEPKRITLSEAEAARMIQSAYRGYEVRRWEPLKKLRQVMEVSKKVAELKNSIQAFESSLDIQGLDKWRTVIGETMMNLLLKLDTIQGMHSSIRDVRKSVAKELVGLQEKVDHLTQKKTETMTQQSLPVLFAENIENKDDLCIKKGREEEKQEHKNSQETDLVNEFHQQLACQAEGDAKEYSLANSGNLETPEMVRDEAENNQRSITEARSAETESQNCDPKLGAFTISQNPDMSMIVTDGSESSLEPTPKVSSAETESEKRVVSPLVGDHAVNPALGRTCSLFGNEISELMEPEEPLKGELSEYTPDKIVQNDPGEGKGLEEVILNEFPKGILDKDTDIQENYQNKQGSDDVSSEGDLESKELEQLPLGVLDDNGELDMHLHIEEEEEKGKTDAVTVDINAEGTIGTVPNMNQAGQRQESTPKVPDTSRAYESLGCEEDKDTNVKLLKMVDHGSEDAVQISEVETSVDSKAVDEPKGVHDKEQTGANNEVFYNKGELSEHFAAENEIRAVTTTTALEVVSETCEKEVSELSFLESQSEHVSSAENCLTDSKNSSNKGASQECDMPLELSKSCDVEDEEKKILDHFELHTSEGPAGIDRTFSHTCNSGALEGELPDYREYGPLKDKHKEEQEIPPALPTAGQISLGSDTFSEGDRKLIEENMKLRDMMQKLIEAGREQLTAISNLSSRVKDLEKRISKKKKLKMRRNGTSRSLSGSSCLKPLNDPQQENSVALAM